MDPIEISKIIETEELSISIVPKKVAVNHPLPHPGYKLKSSETFVKEVFKKTENDYYNCLRCNGELPDDIFWDEKKRCYYKQLVRRMEHADHGGQWCCKKVYDGEMQRFYGETIAEAVNTFLVCRRYFTEHWGVNVNS